jgi:hypothetical protein
MKTSDSEFESFSKLTKRLLSIPKKEIDKRHDEWAKQKDRSHKPKKPTGRGVSRDSGGGNA